MRAPADVQAAAAAGECRVCFCADEVEVVDTGDEFYNKLLRLKADGKRRLAVLEAQLMNGGEVNKFNVPLSKIMLHNIIQS